MLEVHSGLCHNDHCLVPLLLSAIFPAPGSHFKTVLSGTALGSGEAVSWCLSSGPLVLLMDLPPHRQFPLRLLTVTLSEPRHGKKQFRGPIWSQLRRNLLWLRSKRRAQQSPARVEGHCPGLERVPVKKSSRPCVWDSRSHFFPMLWLNNGIST